VHDAHTEILRRRTVARILAALLAVVCCVGMAKPQPLMAQPVSTEQAPLRLADGASVLLLGDAIIAAERTDAAVEVLLRRSFPNRRFSVSTLAQPGEIATLPTRPLDLAALKESLAQQKPTLVLVGVSATGDDDDDSSGDFRDGFRQLLDAVAATKAVTIVITPEVAQGDGAADRTTAASTVAAELSAARSWRYVDLAEVSPLRAALAGEDIAPYTQLSHALSRQPGFARNAWRIDVDVVRRRQTGRGVTVTNLAASPAEVTFTARDDFLPEADGVPGARRVLRIRGLAPGRYTLRIDRRIVATARGREWQRGVTLDKGPDFTQADALARSIRHRNRIASGDIITVEDETPADVAATVARLSHTQPRVYEITLN
jgi:hypothetical protein